MDAENKKNGASVPEKPKDKARQHVNTIVNGCKVRLNFDPNPDSGVIISDVKKMILGGLSKP
jgi:hypothetical protein